VLIFLDYFIIVGMKQKFLTFLSGIDGMLQTFNNILWGKFLIFIILLAGLFLTFYHKLPQKKIILNMLNQNLSKKQKGKSPFSLFLTSLSGSIGIGNIAWITDSTLSAGILVIPAMWVGAFLGTIIKYSEIYISIKYRHKNHDTFEGGPYFLLSKVFTFPFSKIISNLFFFCTLLYTIEVYQFNALITLISSNISISIYTKIILSVLMACIIIYFSNKTKNIISLSSKLVPIFLLFYFVSGFWIIYKNLSMYPIRQSMSLILSTTQRSYEGVLFAFYTGLAASIYSGDIALGYDSIIQVESESQTPQEQAFFSGFIPIADVLICTLTSLITLSSMSISGSFTGIEYINNLFYLFIPFGRWIFLFLGIFSTYSALSVYCSSGQKLSKESRKIQILYCIATFALYIFSAFFPSKIIKNFMSIVASVLIVINLSLIIYKRKEVKI
jgi:AGCS family alanine or glycine:cation symporter